MTDFKLHDLDSAPAEARDRLAAAQKKMGFIPNIFAKMAEAPTTIDAYMTLDQLLAQTSLSAVEVETVLIATSVYNRCEFCVAAHTGRARQAGMDQGALDALRAGGELPDARLNALAEFTRAVVHERGWVDEAKVQKFLDAGFTNQQVLEVILGVTIKTLSNYTNHITGTPLNQELEPLAWKEAS
jgi:uncharacterized peroxidase-related enzyme